MRTKASARPSAMDDRLSPSATVWLRAASALPWVRDLKLFWPLAYGWINFFAIEFI